MNISVFGTGEVGSAVATKLKALGHDTVFGSRRPGSDRDGIPVLSLADAAAHGDWVVNALHGDLAARPNFSPPDGPALSWAIRENRP